LNGKYSYIQETQSRGYYIMKEVASLIDELPPHKLFKNTIDIWIMIAGRKSELIVLGGPDFWFLGWIIERFLEQLFHNSPVYPPIVVSSYPNTYFRQMLPKAELTNHSAWNYVFFWSFS